MVFQEGVLKPQRRIRSLRLRAALVIIPIISLGTLAFSSPAFALTLNSNDAPVIQKLSMYSPKMLLMNLPTEYDVTPASAGPASIPNQVVSSTQTYQTYYTTPPPIPIAGGGGSIHGRTGQLPIIDPCPLGDCVPQSAPYRQNGSSNSGPIVYPTNTGPCTSVVSLVCASGNNVYQNNLPVSGTISNSGPSVSYYQPPSVPHLRPIVTTVTNSGIHITNAKLLRVAPMLFGVNSTGSNLDGVNIQGAPCTTSTTPLISPLSPQFPNYSLKPWRYSTFFSNLGICNINPAWFNGGSTFGTWLDRADSVQFDLQPEWQLTAGYNTVTTVNGVVTNSVPGSSTQVVIAHLYHGPTLPVKAITALPCAISNGVATCPNGSRMPVPS